MLTDIIGGNTLSLIVEDVVKIYLTVTPWEGNAAVGGSSGLSTRIDCKRERSHKLLLFQTGREIPCSAVALGVMELL